MRGLVDLWVETADLSPGEQQTTIRRMLPGRAAELNISIWKPGDSIPKQGTRILVGVSEWNPGDLQFLDWLIGNTVDARIEIFLLADCKSQEDIDCHIPGIARVFQPPVVGVWRDGILVAREQSVPAATKLFAKR